MSFFKTIIQKVLGRSKKTSKCGQRFSESAWVTNTNLSRKEFEGITSYFTRGNNRIDNMTRGLLIGLVDVNVGPGTNIRLGENGKIGKNVHISLFSYINGDVIIEDDCTIGPNCTITSNNHCFNPENQSFKGKNSNEHIFVKRGSWIAAGVTIVAGVIIGECNLICAGAVVTKSTPDYAIVAGVPAKPIGTINPNTGEYIWHKGKKSE